MNSATKPTNRSEVHLLRARTIALALVVIASMLFSLAPAADAASERDNVRVGDHSKNLCLDVRGSDYSNNRNGAKVVVGVCGARDSNKWTRDGSQIKASNGKCLDVHRPDFDNETNGGKVQLWSCSGGSNQQWEVTGNVIRAKGTNLCLDVHRPDYDSKRSGGKVQVWGCAGSVNQRWSSVFISDSGASNQSGGQQSGDQVVGTRGAEVASKTCSSQGNARNTCGTDWEISGLWVKGERKSQALCTPGHSFGYTGSTIWVNHGCRANFGISGTAAAASDSLLNEIVETSTNFASIEDLRGVKYLEVEAHAGLCVARGWAIMSPRSNRVELSVEAQDLGFYNSGCDEVGITFYWTEYGRQRSTTAWDGGIDVGASKDVNSYWAAQNGFRIDVYAVDHDHGTAMASTEDVHRVLND